MDDSQESSPGPEPRRIQLPEDDWKEALRRALVGADPSDVEGEEEGDAEEECASG